MIVKVLDGVEEILSYDTDKKQPQLCPPRDRFREVIAALNEVEDSLPAFNVRPNK